MRPTFWPGTQARPEVVGCPTCWWLPPPWGCSTGFMATPRTLGQQLRFTRYLWYARPALSMGLSMRPPPATMPMVPRQEFNTHFLEPEGRRTFGAVALDVLGDDGSVVAGATGNHTTVTGAHLQVGHDGTLRHRLHWEGVADDELGFGATVHELAGVGALHRWHELLVDLVLARVVEVD